MDITLDLTSNTHYWGYTTWDPATSRFKLVDPVTRQPLEVWDGANRTWAGGNRTWAGANRTWLVPTRSGPALIAPGWR